MSPPEDEIDDEEPPSTIPTIPSEASSDRIMLIEEEEEEVEVEEEVDVPGETYLSYLVSVSTSLLRLLDIFSQSFSPRPHSSWLAALGHWPSCLPRVILARARIRPCLFPASCPPGPCTIAHPQLCLPSAAASTRASRPLRRPPPIRVLPLASAFRPAAPTVPAR